MIVNHQHAESSNTRLRQVQIIYETPNCRDLVNASYNVGSEPEVAFTEPWQMHLYPQSICLNTCLK